MLSVSEQIVLASRVRISNIWLFTDPYGRRVLVDTGHVVERMALLADLWQAGIRKKGDLDAVILTHRHCDHAGNANWLRNRFDCPIYCHENDAAYLRREKQPERLRRGLGAWYDELLCRFEDVAPIRCDVDGVFKAGPWRFGLEVIPAFGHTEGSVMLYQKDLKALFSGDVLLGGMPPLFLRPSFSLAVAAYSVDVEQAHRRVVDYLRQAPEIQLLCSGHGKPVSENLASRLNRIVETAA